MCVIVHKFIYPPTLHSLRHHYISPPSHFVTVWSKIYQKMERGDEGRSPFTFQTLASTCWPSLVSGQRNCPHLRSFPRLKTPWQCHKNWTIVEKMGFKTLIHRVAEISRHQQTLLGSQVQINNWSVEPGSLSPGQHQRTLTLIQSDTEETLGLIVGEFTQPGTGGRYP